MLKYLLLFGGGFLLSLMLTPIVRQVALRVGAVDMPNARKVHDRPVPRLGGVAIFLSFNLILVLAFSPASLVHSPFLTVAEHWWRGFIMASAIVVQIGIFDDIRPLGARVKFLTQLLAALVAVYFGYTVDRIGFGGDHVLELGIWSIPVTVLWIVGLTNAFNLIDGLDGLASGVALIALCTLAGVAVLNNQVELALISSVLAGCLLGFLRYNFPPATIFLGDSGSLFLGFTLAVMSITTIHKASTTATILVSILAFGLPIMDTLLAMLRRFLRPAPVMEPAGSGPYQRLFQRARNMFEADRDHIHHRLMKLGITHRNAVLILYAICAVASVVALSLVVLQNVNTGLVLVVSGLLTCLAIQKLRYRELQWLRNGVLLPVMRFQPLGSKPVQMFVDGVVVVWAYYLAWLIYGEGNWLLQARAAANTSVIAFVLSVLLVFHLMGFYQIRWEYAGIPDLLRAVQTIVLGFIAGVVILNVCQPDLFRLPVLVLNLFILGILSLGARFSLRLLTYYAQSNSEQKRKVLIYGAGRAGCLLVRELLSNAKHSMVTVGFIDDDPRKKGMWFHGFPVFGSCAELTEAIQQSDAQELILAIDGLTGERLADIRRRCAQNEITLRRIQFTLKEISVSVSDDRPVPAAGPETGDSSPGSGGDLKRG